MQRSVEFPRELEQLRAAQAEQLKGPYRREQRLEAGAVVTALVIPVEEAMEIVVEEEGTEALRH